MNSWRVFSPHSAEAIVLSTAATSGPIWNLSEGRLEPPLPLAAAVFRLKPVKIFFPSACVPVYDAYLVVFFPTWYLHEGPGVGSRGGLSVRFVWSFTFQNKVLLNGKLQHKMTALKSVLELRSSNLT